MNWKMKNKRILILALTTTFVAVLAIGAGAEPIVLRDGLDDYQETADALLGRDSWSANLNTGISMGPIRLKGNLKHLMVKLQLSSTFETGTDAEISLTIKYFDPYSFPESLEGDVAVYIRY